MTMNDQKSLNGFMKNWESKNIKKHIQPKRESTTHSRKQIEFESFMFIQSFIRMYKARQLFKKKLKECKYRKRVAEEILNTEKTYVHVLSSIVNLFIRPIEESHVISNEDVKEIFSNVEIIQRVNSTLLIDLSDRIENWTPNRQIGDVFIQLSDFFKVYIDYVKNYNNAIDRLNECKKDEDFQKFLKIQMMKVEKYERDEIQSLLITPVQRIPRYALLISDLLRHTSSDHADFANLQIAQEKLKSTASYVNSRAELAIELTKIYSIQNSIYGKFDSFLERDRRLIRDGFANKFTPMKKKKTAIYIILFNDCLVCCKNEKKYRNTQKFEFISQIPLFSSFLVQYPDDPLHCNMNCFSLETRKEKCFISCETIEEKQQWIAEINKQILETNEKLQFYEAKKDEVASHKAEEARALIAEKYTTMRVRGSNSESDIGSVSGKRRFASLRKPNSPLQKYENIESSKLFTENLLREEELSNQAKQIETEKKSKASKERSDDFKESTAQRYQRMNSEEEINRDVIIKKDVNKNNSKSDYKVRSWSLKRKKLQDSKEKIVFNSSDQNEQNEDQNQNNNHKDNNNDNDNDNDKNNNNNININNNFKNNNHKNNKNYQKNEKNDNNNNNNNNNNKQVIKDNDFEMELQAKLKARVRSNTLCAPKISLSDENIRTTFKKKKSEDDMHVKISTSNSSNNSPPNSPQLRTWATRTRTAYTPRNGSN